MSLSRVWPIPSMGLLLVALSAAVELDRARWVPRSQPRGRRIKPTKNEVPLPLTLADDYKTKKRTSDPGEVQIERRREGVGCGDLDGSLEEVACIATAFLEGHATRDQLDQVMESHAEVFLVEIRRRSPERAQEYFSEDQP